MTTLTIISPHIGPFTKEGYDLLIDKLLYPGLENQTVLHGISYVSSVECTRHIRIILQAIWVNNMWYSLRHNESLVDMVR